MSEGWTFSAFEKHTMQLLTMHISGVHLKKANLHMTGLRIITEEGEKERTEFEPIRE